MHTRTAYGWAIKTVIREKGMRPNEVHDPILFMTHTYVYAVTYIDEAHPNDCPRELRG